MKDLTGSLLPQRTSSPLYITTKGKKMGKKNQENEKAALAVANNDLVSTSRQCNDNTVNKNIKPPQKQEVALIEFEQRGELGMNTLEANHSYNDTALHSTVSDFRRNHGIILERRLEKYKNRYGRSTPFKRYWVAPVDIERVREVIDRLRKNRGAVPLFQIDKEVS